MAKLGGCTIFRRAVAVLRVSLQQKHTRPLGRIDQLPAVPSAGSKAAVPALRPAAQGWEQLPERDPIASYWRELAASRQYRYSITNPFASDHRHLKRSLNAPPATEEEIADAISFLQRLQKSLRVAVSPEQDSSPQVAPSEFEIVRPPRSGVLSNPFRNRRRQRHLPGPEAPVHPKFWEPKLTLPARTVTARLIAPPQAAIPKPGATLPTDIIRGNSESREAAPPREQASKPPIAMTAASSTSMPTPAITDFSPPALTRAFYVAPPPPARRPQKNWRVALMTATCALSLAALGVIAYLRIWSTPSVNREPVASRESRRGNDSAPSQRSLENIALAKEAIQRGDLGVAADRVAEVIHGGGKLSGLAYQAALIAYYQGNREQSDAFIEQSIAADDFVAECWYLRALASFQSEGLARAAEDLRQAIYAAPFNPRYYFFRGECLRRNGNDTQALAEFREALRCRPNTADAELISFKIGLTRLETGTDINFKSELDEQLNRKPVPGDALLLAAADAINRDDPVGATEMIKRAAQAMPAPTVEARMRDFAFRTFTARQKLSPPVRIALTSDPSRDQAPHSAPVLIDPATRSLAEADPAGW